MNTRVETEYLAYEILHWNERTEILQTSMFRFLFFFVSFLLLMRVRGAVYSLATLRFSRVDQTTPNWNSLIKRMSLMIVFYTKMTPPFFTKARFLGSVVYNHQVFKQKRWRRHMKRRATNNELNLLKVAVASKVNVQLRMYLFFRFIFGDYSRLYQDNYRQLHC